VLLLAFTYACGLYIVLGFIVSASTHCWYAPYGRMAFHD
jgi:hypothetical protein